MTPIERFTQLGQIASFHYADDSGEGWALSAEARLKALAVFDSFPELQPEFRQIAKGFLWPLNRPETPDGN